MSRRVVAITLGSNGFHLVEMQSAGGRIEPGEHLYDAVQAESFVDHEDRISEAGRQRILAALASFRAFLDRNPGAPVSAIATGTFRRTANGAEVATEAAEVLGVPVQVLGGQDESLLSYIGMASQVGLSPDNRLVLDIGGGSTELIIARDNQLLEYVSLDLGCVSLTQRFFEHEFTADAFTRTREHCAAILDRETRKLAALGWTETLACGGSISALFSVMQQRRLCGRFITPASLERFRERVVADGDPYTLCDGISPRSRSRTLPSAVGLIGAIIDTLGVEKIAPVFSSVVQGLIIRMLQS